MKKQINKYMVSLMAVMLAFMFVFTALPISASNNDKNVVFDIKGGVVEVKSTTSSTIKTDFDPALCSVSVKESGSTTTVTVTSLKNNWSDKVCSIALPDTFKDVDVKTAHGAVVAVSEVNANVSVADKGKTTVEFPKNFNKNVDVTAEGITKLVLPKNLDNYTFTMEKTGNGIVMLPFSDFHFLSKSYSKVVGNGKQTIDITAKGLAMVTVSFAE